MSIVAIYEERQTNRTSGVNGASIDIGKRLRILRMQRKRSQQWLADQLGITFQQIQKYENGKNNISLPKLLEICVVFEVDWSHFLDPMTFPSEQVMPVFRYRTTTELVEAFERIADGKDRRTIVSFVQMFAEKAV